DADQRLVGVVHDEDVFRTAATDDLMLHVALEILDNLLVLQSGFQHLGRAGLDVRTVRSDRDATRQPLRQQHNVAIAAAGVVGILVGEDPHAASPGFYDQVDHHTAAAPEVFAAGLDERGDHFGAGGLGHVDQLHDVVDHGQVDRAIAARQIPHGIGPGAALVDRVHMVALGQFGNQGLDLLRGRPAAGHV